MPLRETCPRPVLCVGGSGKPRSPRFHSAYFISPRCQAGRPACGRSVCCLFLLLLSKFQEGAREAPVAEREGEGAGGPSWGRRGGGDWSGRRRDPDGARDTHTRARLGQTHQPDTFSHSGSRTPPALRGHPDTLSQPCQSPGHSLDTHGEPGPPSSPPPPNRVGSRQQPEGGGGGGRKDSRQQGLCSQGLEAAAGLPHSFPKT